MKHSLSSGVFDPKPSFLVQQMDEAGIDQIMLCAWNRPNQTIVSNDDIVKYTTVIIHFLHTSYAYIFICVCVWINLN